ncbi:MAG: NAD(P)-dependent oxidoreductase [Candidatus Latescibacteria bacterium]|jgi:nucleoside-diphosphate-sugar epimerase|nr:NAD(P)-dependent oxidoreductase [Candidatus Latescibacterota bacterium]
MKKVLLLGASGLIAPHIIPGLETHYYLKLADVKPHPEGVPVLSVDVTDYSQVLEAARGVDIIMNWTVLRHDDTLSFQVNTQGAFHVMKAAAELGIKKVLHTGPSLVLGYYEHDFDIPDAPVTPSTDYYFISKYLSNEIVKSYARAYKIHTLCYLFQGLRARPENPLVGRDFPPFTIIYDDLVHAVRLALELESVPDYFQHFNLHSHLGQGKYSMDKAKRILGYVPQRPYTDLYKRTS